MCATSQDFLTRPNSRVESRCQSAQAEPVNSLTARLSVILALVLSGCGNQPTSPGSSPPVSTNAPTAGSTNSAPSVVTQPSPKSESNGPRHHLDKAQAKLPTVSLRIGAKTLRAEVCSTLTQVATGMMFRPGIGPEEGMLFVFAGAAQRSFYMRNVDFDINAAYIDTEGVVQEIVTLRKRDESPVPSASKNIQFFLETAPDWFTRNGIGVGTLILTDQGASLREALARRAQLH